MALIKLAVGLGNPGQIHEWNRHNSGSIFITRLVSQYHATMTKVRGQPYKTAIININGEAVSVIIPLLPLNNSGAFIFSLMQRLKIKNDELLIVHDDLDIPPGQAKIKYSGVHDRHKGVIDIVNATGHNPDFYRLRIGIGHPGRKGNVIDYVMQDPKEEELKLIYQAMDKAIECFELLQTVGVNRARERLHSFSA
ncbi:aminoacyl-tRNA hydrolase [Serratia marcescens]|uniref:aminoacyl-tRNA hydrolase n=1 Tax=Serratia marcescens TaxID=615 RepID=UPI00163974C9|nr:aminoacyl-tRNA hydrolase [Serratia marcescens]HEJ7121859.1 aminoacyl-tRNA hydrolase [Serratia marcescens]